MYFIKELNSSSLNIFKEKCDHRVLLWGLCKGFILKAYKSKALWQEMGKNGRDHVVENYTRSVVTERYHKLIQTIVR